MRRAERDGCFFIYLFFLTKSVGRGANRQVKDLDSLMKSELSEREGSRKAGKKREEWKRGLRGGINNRI